MTKQPVLRCVLRSEWRSQVADLRGEPQKLLHSPYAGQKWPIFINYISDLQITDILVGMTGFPDFPWARFRSRWRSSNSKATVAQHVPEDELAADLPPVSQHPAFALELLPGEHPADREAIIYCRGSTRHLASGLRRRGHLQSICRATGAARPSTKGRWSTEPSARKMSGDNSAHKDHGLPCLHPAYSRHSKDECKHR